MTERKPLDPVKVAKAARIIRAAWARRYAEHRTWCDVDHRDINEVYDCEGRNDDR